MSAASAIDSCPVIRADGNYFGSVYRRFLTGGLVMSETAYRPGAHIPSHDHECPNFFMPLERAFVEGCADRVRRYEPGDVSYHPPGEPHWLRTHGAGARGFAVEVGDRWRTGLGEETSWGAVPRDLSRSRLSWLMSRLYLELRVHDTARPLVVEGLGVEIGIELMATPVREERHKPPWFSRVRELLSDRCTETVSLSELCAVAGVSAVAIIKAFRRYEGVTPGGFVRLARLAEARRVVAGTDRSLSAIALDAGFYDQSHFTRAFKAVVGTSPSAFRRLMRTPRPA